MKNEIIFLVNFMSLSSFVTHSLFISKNDIQQKRLGECENKCEGKKMAKARIDGNRKRYIYLTNKNIAFNDKDRIRD